MITLVKPYDKRKSKKKHYQNLKDEESSFFDEDLFDGDNKIISFDENEFDSNYNINDNTFSKQKKEPKCTDNVHSGLKEKFLNESIRASNALITERIKEILREDENNHKTKERQCLCKKREK